VEDPLGDAGMSPRIVPTLDPAAAVKSARRGLEAQRERGEWSGVISTSGSPIYTLKEIAAAVVREQEKVTQG
jgi:hypothetical protein